MFMLRCSVDRIWGGQKTDQAMPAMRPVAGRLAPGASRISRLPPLVAMTVARLLLHRDGTHDRR